MTKTILQCIEILQNEVNPKHDEKRIQSAYKSLVEIYMTCLNIERKWLPLFRKAFEFVISDSNIRDHCKIYIKYLKILKNLDENEMLLKSSTEMLESYPNEYIPMDMVCLVYVKNYNNPSFDFQVSGKFRNILLLRLQNGIINSICRVLLLIRLIRILIKYWEWTVQLLIVR